MPTQPTRVLTQQTFPTRTVFRRIASDRNEWRSEDGRFVIEKVYGEGPRGGSRVMWAAYEVRDGRLALLCSERRLRDVWGHLPIRPVS